VIRIHVSEDHLHASIEGVSPGWHAKKKKAWSDVKPVYLALQSNLCAYCEAPRDFVRAEVAELDAAPREKDGEFAVEHFRPKGATSRWPDASAKRRLEGAGVDVLAVRAGRASGYGKLRFSPWNYVASCYTCNSTLKANRFPIAGAATAPKGPDRLHIEALNDRERPLLLFPLGDLDEDPEAVIGWNGVMPVPKRRRDAADARGAVTIVFFRLDGVGRPRLLEARFRQLATLLALLKIEADVSLVLKTEPFRACMRAYHARWLEDPEAAAQLFLAQSDEIDVIRGETEARRKKAAGGKLRAPPRRSARAEPARRARSGRGAG
jgi:hypothetical protein